MSVGHKVNFLDEIQKTPFLHFSDVGNSNGKRGQTRHFAVFGVLKFRADHVFLSAEKIILKFPCGCNTFVTRRIVQYRYNEGVESLIPTKTQKGEHNYATQL